MTNPAPSYTPDVNRDYRQRERGYSPSVEAIADAEARGVRPGPKAGPQYWYVAADRFLGTFNRYWRVRNPGSRMEIG